MCVIVLCAQRVFNGIKEFQVIHKLWSISFTNSHSTCDRLKLLCDIVDIHY